MNSLFLSICAFIVGLCWMASAPLKAALLNLGYDIVPDDNILLAILGVLFFIVVKRIRALVDYTDEVLPYYLSLAGFVLSIAGAFLFTRLMLLGGLSLVAAAYWSQGVVRSYYR